MTGRDDENTEATAQDSHSLTVTNATPTITVAKSAANINEGNTATYTFTIKNTSTASTDPVTISSVSDNVLGSLTADANAAWLAQGNTGAIVLAQNQSFTFTFTTGVLNAGPVTNTVTVSGQDDEGTSVTAQDSHTLTVANVAPTITVDKTVSNISEGNTATYTYKITNTSPASTDPVTITSVIDDVLGDLTDEAIAANGGNPIVLAPGAFFSFDYTTLTAFNAGTVTNVVTVSGQDDENTTTSATDTATLTVANVAPSLTIDKTASATIVEGNTVTYSFTITNTSTASTDPVTINSISDNVLGNLLPAALAANGGSPIVLAPGASFSFTYTTLTVLNVATITNTVTVTGQDDELTLATATDSHTLDVTNATPTITVDKTPPTSAKAARRPTTLPSRTPAPPAPTRSPSTASVMTFWAI